MSKSSKHRALARERHEALKAGTLPEFYASRAATLKLEAEKGRAAAERAPPPDYSIRTLDGASWPADETGYSKYMKWTLPTNSGSSGRPTPPRNF